MIDKMYAQTQENALQQAIDREGTKGDPRIRGGLAGQVRNNAIGFQETAPAPSEITEAVIKMDREIAFAEELRNRLFERLRSVLRLDAPQSADREGVCSKPAYAASEFGKLLLQHGHRMEQVNRQTSELLDLLAI